MLDALQNYTSTRCCVHQCWHAVRVCILASTLAIACAACEEAPTSKTPSLSADEVNQILDSPPVPVSWGDVATTFALGGSHTDLQRQMMTDKLIGHVVEWRIRVYDISLEGDRYRLISEPAEIPATDVINLIRVIAFIPVTDVYSVEALQGAQTGATLTVRGMVKEITLRTAVVLVPATTSSIN